MPLVQFKSATKYDGKPYRQNERHSCSEARAARLVAMNAAELVHGQTVSAGFNTMVETIRTVRSDLAKARPPVPKAIREKAAAEKCAFFRRFPWLETATQS
jgi:hypothetical protein